MKNSKRLTAIAVLLVLMLAGYAAKIYLIDPIKKDSEQLVLQVSAKETEILSRYGVLLNAGQQRGNYDAIREEIASFADGYYRGLPQDEYLDELDRFIGASALDVQHIECAEIDEREDGSARVGFTLSGISSAERMYAMLSVLEENDRVVSVQNYVFQMMDEGLYRYDLGTEFPDLRELCEASETSAPETEEPYELPPEFLTGAYRADAKTVRDLLSEAIRNLSSGLRSRWGL